MHVLAKVVASQTINQSSRQINFSSFRILLFTETSALFICILITSPIINSSKHIFLNESDHDKPPKSKQYKFGTVDQEWSVLSVNLPVGITSHQMRYLGL